MWFFQIRDWGSKTTSPWLIDFISLQTCRRLCFRIYQQNAEWTYPSSCHCLWQQAWWKRCSWRFIWIKSEGFSSTPNLWQNSHRGSASAHAHCQTQRYGNDYVSAERSCREKSSQENKSTCEVRRKYAYCQWERMWQGKSCHCVAHGI